MNLRSKLPVPQRLKPSSLLVPDGTTERRALPKTIYEIASSHKSAQKEALRLESAWSVLLRRERVRLWYHAGPDP